MSPKLMSPKLMSPKDIAEASQDLVKAAEDLNNRTEELNTKLRLQLQETERWPHVRAYTVTTGLVAGASASSLRPLETFHWRKLRDTWCLCWEREECSFVQLMYSPLVIRSSFLRFNVFAALQRAVLEAARTLVGELDATLSK